MNQDQKGNTITMIIIIAVAIIIASSVVYIMAARIGGSKPVKVEAVKAPVRQQSPIPTARTMQIAPTDENAGACAGKAYDGKVTVKGWYVWDKGHAGNEWLLEIADDDINKLPLPEALSKDPGRYVNFNQKLRLVDAGPELQKELKAATKDSPKEIALEGYYWNCKGPASVSIAPATESFKKHIEK